MISRGSSTVDLKLESTEETLAANESVEVERKGVRAADSKTESLRERSHRCRCRTDVFPPSQSESSPS